MGIEELKRWHWIVIGLLLGLGLAYARSGMEPQVGRNNVVDFLSAIRAPLDAKTGPIVRSIVIHPATVDYRGQRLNVVTYKRLCRSRDGKRTDWQSEQLLAESPFRGFGRGGEEPATSIRDYLDAIKKENPSISYRYAWWDLAPAQYAMWTGGSVLVIGILWPNVLFALMGAGYGPKRDPNAKKESLFSYKSRPEPQLAAAKPRASAADEQKLRDMTDRLERNLAAVATHHGDHAAAAAPDPAGVRKLDGGPLEMAPAQAKADDDDIEIKGEYYPVLIHHKKQRGESHDDDDNDPSST
jgi:hypothetical protein